VSGDKPKQRQSEPTSVTSGEPNEIQKPQVPQTPTVGSSPDPALAQSTNKDQRQGAKITNS